MVVENGLIDRTTQSSQIDTSGSKVALDVHEPPLANQYSSPMSSSFQSYWLRSCH